MLLILARKIAKTKFKIIGICENYDDWLKDYDGNIDKFAEVKIVKVELIKVLR